MRAELDHVALALPELTPLWPVLAGDLGGRWAGGGRTAGGFAFGQVRFEGGMKVEGLEPYRSERNGFLVRFLASSGPGPHHLTFTVDDLPDAIERAGAAGYEPVAVDLSGASWKEAFLHPRQAGGIVVQLAWSGGEPGDRPPAGFPTPRVEAPAELVHVAHAVADLEAALALFKGVLGGTSADAGAGGGLGWVDVVWPGGGRLRLLAGDPVEGWLGGRPGRLHHLGLRVEAPAGVTGAVARAAWWEVAPTPPLGTRLVLVEPGGVLPIAV